MHLHSVKSAIAVGLLKLSARLPLTWLHRLGNGLGRLVGWLPNRARKVTRINLELCLPELSPAARQALLYESLRESGKALFEYGFVSLRPVETVIRLVKSSHNIQLLHDAMSYQQGLIVMTPHLGNWEVLSLYLAQHYRVTGLYRPSKLISADKLVYAARARSGSVPIPATPAGVAKLRRALSDGWLTVILPDQQPRRNNGIYAPFFGVSALSMRLVSTLCKKAGCRVLSMYARRRPDGDGYEIVCLEPDPGVYSDDLQTSVAAVNHSMEQCIRNDPAQYHWEYARFSNRPEGEPHFYNP